MHLYVKTFKETLLKNGQVLRLLLLLAVSGEVGALLYLLILPTDTLYPVAFGYSANRILMIGGFLFVLLISIILTTLPVKSRWYRYLSQLLNINIMPSLALLGILIGFSLSIFSFSNIFPNRFVAERLRPIFLLFLWLSAIIAGYQTIFLGRRPIFQLVQWLSLVSKKISLAIERVIPWLDERLSMPVLIIIALFITAPFLFLVPLRNSFPLGYAGLFTLISEKIAQGSYHLPDFIPYYGPGGIPMAYPPAGFYLMAFVMNVLHVEPFTYLRLAPSLFMWLAMIPLAIIAFDISGSRVGSLIAVILVAGSQKIFTFQASAAGMVRGLAFLFVMVGIWLFLAACRKGSWKYSALAGVMFGLTAFTHLGYGEFAAVFAAAYFISHLRSQRTWSMLLVAGAAALVVISPWVIAIVNRSGWGVFQNAFQSHDNNYFLLLLHDPGKVIPWINEALRPVARNSLMWGMTLFGLLYALLDRKILLPIWFGLVLLFVSENARYLITIGAILAGLSAARFSGLFSTDKDDRVLGSFSAMRKGAFFCLTIAAIFFINGWIEIIDFNQNQPLINHNTIEMAAYVRKNTPENFHYLVITDMNEAEWFPYLLRRTPVIGSWGGEWTGAYQRNLSDLINLAACEQAQSLDCIQGIINQTNIRPELLITRSSEDQLNQQINASQKWQTEYRNADYILWQIK